MAHLSSTGMYLAGETTLEVARDLFSDSDYMSRLLERKANAPRFQARAQENRNLMRNSIRLRQVLCVCM